MRAFIAGAGLVGGSLLMLLLLSDFNPETPVELRLKNLSAHDAVVRYDGGPPTAVASRTDWALENDENGDHVLEIQSRRAPVGFRLLFNSAPWNAKSFSLRLQIIEAN